MKKKKPVEPVSQDQALVVRSIIETAHSLMQVGSFPGQYAEAAVQTKQWLQSMIDALPKEEPK